jgi:hypothetical protein
MPDRAIASAHELTEALNENTAALKAVKRRFRFVLVFVIMVALVVAAVIKARYEARVDACHRDATLRTGLLHIADTLDEDTTLYLTQVPGYSDLDPAMQVYLQVLEDRSASNGGRAVLVAELRKQFAITQDCGSISWI